MPDTEFHLQRVDTRLGPLALLTMDNGADHTKPTVLGRSAIESARRALDELERGDWIALVVTGKPFVFAAGADIEEFPRCARARRRSPAAAPGTTSSAASARCPIPTVAAINGACLGGGLEVALHCDARTISKAVRHFAARSASSGSSPPGAARSSSRGSSAPRRRCASTSSTRCARTRCSPARRRSSGASPTACSSRRVPGRVDRVRAGARRAGRHAARRGRSLGRRRGGRARPAMQLDDSVHGAAPAPYRALDLTEGAATWSVEDGYRAEEEAVAISCCRRRRAPRSTRSTSSSGARSGSRASPTTSSRAACARSASSARG